MNSSETTDKQLWHLADKLNIPLNEICFKNELCTEMPFYGGYIINMANSDSQGTHWISCWLENRNESCCYFDSFGIEPPIEVIEFCNRWNHNILLSEKEIQNINSGHCGQYCIDFLLFMSKSKLPLKQRYYNFLAQF